MTRSRIIATAKRKGRKKQQKRQRARARPKRRLPVQQLAMSVTEWCAAYGVSRNLFYELQKLGLAPDSMLLRKRQIITNAASERWERQREAAEVAARQEQSKVEAETVEAEAAEA